jgi:hypothetical protein
MLDDLAQDHPPIINVQKNDEGRTYEKYPGNRRIGSDDQADADHGQQTKAQCLDEFMPDFRRAHEVSVNIEISAG